MAAPRRTIAQFSRSLSTSTREAALIQIPSPNVYPREGSNNISVQADLPFLTPAHSLAIVNAVQAKCGKVVGIQQAKHWDTQMARSRLTLQVLNPVHFQKPIILELPQPSLAKSPKITHYGPSLETLRDVMQSQTTTQDQTTTATFRAEIKLEPPTTIRQFNAAQYRPYIRSRLPVRPELREAALKRKEQEDEEICMILKDGFPGFYGGFKELSDLMAGFRPKVEEQPAVEPVDVSETTKQPETLLDLFPGDVLGDSTANSLPQNPAAESSSTPALKKSATPPKLDVKSSPSISQTLKAVIEPSSPPNSKQTKLAQLIIDQQKSKSIFSSSISSPPTNSESRAVRAARLTVTRPGTSATRLAQEEQRLRAKEKSERVKSIAERRRKEEEKGAMGKIKGWLGNLV